MTIQNLEYLYAHLPARIRRDDADLFLKRFLSFFGQTLDGFDLQVDTFYQKIDPATAPQEFIDWWLYALFGWAWFPGWFTDERRRAFYAAIATHYARRGTARGIKEFLSAFGLKVIVDTQPRFWDEQAFGESGWIIDGPLGIVIRLFPEAPAVNADLQFWDDGTWDESAAADAGESIQRADLDELLRFCWPLGNIIMIEDLQIGAAVEQGIPPGYGDGEYGSAIPG